MKHLTYIFFAFAALLFSFPSFAATDNYLDASDKQPKTLHYTDTVRSPNKQAQFRKAIELAPTVFVYDEMVWKDSNTVTVKGMRFNKSMDNTLKCEIVEDDPGLAKRLKRINAVTRPLNGVIDLTVSFHDIPVGIAVDYLIENISVFGIGRSSDKKK